MILHMTLNLLHYYLVQGNGTMYRYVFSARKYRSSENEPASKAISAYISTQDRYIEDSTRPGQEDVRGYVNNIEKADSSTVQPAETQVLRKIRI
jgi:hypothetical protein